MSKSARRKARVKQRKQMTARAAALSPVLRPKAATARGPAPPPKKAVRARAATPPDSGELAPADVLHAFFMPTGLLNVAAIARRDLTALFVSPVGWVVGGIFVFLVSTFGFYVTVIAGRTSTMEGVFGVITSFLMPVLVPLITMRVFAEERSQGTLELLLTSPVRDWELTLGKWLAALAFYLLLLSTTTVYVLLLRMHTPQLDLGLIAATYLGLVLVGAAAVAIGVLASSLSRNQIIAFFVAMFALLVIWYAGYVIGFYIAPPANRYFGYIGGFNRFQSFSLGEAALRDVVYFLTVTAGALFLTTRVLGSRRWR